MTPKVCPYCGTRDRRPGRDSCGPCEQPVKEPHWREASHIVIKARAKERR